MENEFRIRKIQLESFIEILNQLYDKGIDFIDLSGYNKNGEDTIGIFFTSDYINEEYKDNFDEEDIEKEQKTLTDQDIRDTMI